ncbi:hypothetical protein BC936DRAFT_147682 [Jimgerdemannia flammicorona]|uniref:Uncharacterized protein n=2 Tax=Jimgerdemannia flammicorona TaxID=994334 RepID=A0A433D4P9_9FUNG|nr:hypothetical protein BC936DRAFT_147682 [Jimgerdemannia flammicorona]RUS30629.1 hypothetical protein BC938DRAFT_479137 [Jimgerdemannia flammicorona]
MGLILALFPPSPLFLCYDGVHNCKETTEPIMPPIKTEKNTGTAAKSGWSQQEDTALTEGRENGLSWEEISAQLPGRTVIACKRRFDNRQRQSGPWSEEEVAVLSRSFDAEAAEWREFWKKVAKGVGNGRSWQNCAKKMMDDWKKQ